MRTARGHPERIDALERALAAWRGEALDEFAAEPWAQGESARLEELRSAGVEELAGLLIDADRPTEAIAELERQIARRPLADRPRLLLLRALAAAGRRTEALRSYQAYRSYLAEAVGTEPGPELRAAERRIALDGGSSSGDLGPVEGVAANRVVGRVGGGRGRGAELPIPATRWIGAGETLARLAEEITSARVVTLIGPGGVGKTRPAIEIGRTIADRFADGVWLAELATIAEPEQVADAVASTLGCPTQAGLSVRESIVDRLRGRHLLLVLDNCEHVIAAAAELVRAIVAGSASVTVLATSREPLRVRGERVLAVAPLTVADGVELFRERAHAADDSLRFSADDLRAIASICEQLDGIPLALELAAARARSLAPTDLLDRLGHRFRLLGGARDGLSHQRTLRDTVEWSYRLLSSEEQLLFDRLAVFAGSFDLVAVERICGSPPFEPDAVGELLAALVDKSMVVVERGSSATRYRLLETLRQFGEEHLARRRQSAATSFRHLCHYLDVAEHTHQRWFSPQQLEADARYDLEWDNLRAAHSFAIATHDRPRAARLLEATIGHSQYRMRGEHGAWCLAASALSTPDEPISPVVLGWAGWWSMVAGEHARSLELTTEALRSPGPPDDPGTALCRSVAAFALWSSGKRAEAATLVEQLEATLELLDPWYEYTAQRALFSFSVGPQFGVRATRIAALTEGIGAISLIASARFYQGSAATYSGEEADALIAADLHQQGIDLARSAGAEFSECQNMQGLLEAMRGLGDRRHRRGLPRRPPADVRPALLAVLLAGRRHRRLAARP